MPHVGDVQFIDSLRTEAETKPHKLCSVYPRSVYPSHWTNGGGYHVPPPQPGEKYGFCLVNAGEHKYDLGDARFFIAKDISSGDMARDIIGLSRPRRFYVPESSQWVNVPERTESQWKRMGLFVPEGDEPTDKEIEDARNCLLKYMGEKLLEGDVEYQRSGNPRHVEEISRVAAEYLKADRPWIGRIGEVQDKIQCPACREKINNHATKCIHCNSKLGYNGDGKVFELVEKPMAAVEQRK